MLDTNNKTCFNSCIDSKTGERMILNKSQAEAIANALAALNNVAAGDNLMVLRFTGDQGAISVRREAALTLSAWHPTFFITVGDSDGEQRREAYPAYGDFAKAYGLEG